MSLYVLTLRSTYFDQEIINRFPYTSTVEPSGVSGSNMLAQFFGVVSSAGSFLTGSVMRYMQSLQSSEVHYNEVEVMNLYDPADFYVFPFTSDLVGANSEGQAMAPFIAYGLYSNRVTRAIRRGTRRFVGVVENQVVAGGGIDTGMLALLQDLADEMSSVLNPDNTGSEGVYTPSVFHYQKYTTSTGREAYRPWPTEAEQLANNAVGVTWTPYTTVRSQTSRQYGRGA
jgi:hypothetical protein